VQGGLQVLLMAGRERRDAKAAESDVLAGEPASGDD
jgi:hypothetical protein